MDRLEIKLDTQAKGVVIDATHCTVKCVLIGVSESWACSMETAGPMLLTLCAMCILSMFLHGRYPNTVLCHKWA